MKFPLLIAFWKVEITGDPAQACKYCASSRRFVFMYYFLAGLDVDVVIQSVHRQW